MAEMLDVLANQKTVEELARAKSEDEVRSILKQSGIDATEQNIDTVGNVFSAAAQKLDESELEGIGGGIDWKSKKAKKVYLGLGGTLLLLGGGYLLDKYQFEGKGLKAVKGAAAKGVKKANNFLDEIKYDNSTI